MAWKKKAAHPENHERWLVSYADFITLLFAFFVVMFATSQTDRSKAKDIQEAVKRALEQDQIVSAVAGILGGTPDDSGKGNAQMRGPGGVNQLKNAPQDPQNRWVELEPIKQRLEQELAPQIAANDMSVTMEARGLVVSFQQAAFFPSGTDEIPVAAFSKVSKVAEIIQGVPNPVRLEGHTDALPVRGGRFGTNWELSAARAISMMELLARCCSIPRERMSVAGYAENAPVGANDTEEGRRRNRRVDIVILNETGIAAEPTTAARTRAGQ
jgi:chemotaxis protein MotB